MTPEITGHDAAARWRGLRPSGPGAGGEGQAGPDGTAESHGDTNREDIDCSNARMRGRPCGKPV